MIAVVDYGAGNLKSVVKALSHLGHEARVTSRPQEVLSASAIILPGVGAAAPAMESLERLGLADALRRIVEQGRPLLGVCLGLQLLFTATEEGGCPCLALLPGRIRRLPSGLKVPHMGWNQVRWLRPHPIFQGIPQNAHFYFVHSYYAEPQDPALIVGETDYGLTFGSFIARDNLVATQFHPEKSGEVGLQVYKNFLAWSLGRG